MFDYYLKGQVVDSKQTLMSEDQSVMGLLGARIVCRVDCANEMNDGTLMTGFVVTFNYEDGTTSKANAQGPWGQGGGASVYSLDKCVKWNKIQIGARRPSGIVEVINDGLLVATNLPTVIGGAGVGQFTVASAKVPRSDHTHFVFTLHDTLESKPAG